MAHDSEPAYVLALAVVFIILCPIFTALRMYTRMRNDRKGLGIDDWLVLFALFLVLGCCITDVYGVRTKAFAYPSSPAEKTGVTELYRTRQKLEFVFFLLMPLAMGSIKLSFVALFRRIFLAGNPKSIFGVISTTANILVGCWMLAFALWWILECGNWPAAIWTSHAAADDYCSSTFLWHLGFALSDFLSDILVLALPIVPIMRLHLKTSRKLAVLGIFSLSFTALAASTVRMAIFNSIMSWDGEIKQGDYDIALTITRVIYWSTLEAGLSFVASNLPAAGSLLKGRSMTSFIASVRSLQSLRSKNSSRSRQDTEAAGQSSNTGGIDAQWSAGPTKSGTDIDTLGPQSTKQTFGVVHEEDKLSF